MIENSLFWERLQVVIEHSGKNPNAFARSIGLKKGENIYQIKRGNNRISFKLALRIEQHYPEFCAAWLLTGDPRVCPDMIASQAEEYYCVPHNDRC